MHRSDLEELELAGAASVERSKVSRRTRRRIFWCWAVVVLAYFLWEAANYAGLYRLLAEWQIGQIGRYLPMLTIGALWLVFVLPAALLLLRRRNNPDLIQSPLVRAERLNVRMLPVLMFAAAGFAILSLASLAYTLFLPDARGTAQTVTLGSPTLPRAGHSKIEGIGFIGEIAQFRQYWPGNERSVSLAPVFGRGDHDRVIRYFVEVMPADPERRPAAIPVATHEGVLFRGEMPGTILALYRAAGYRIANDYFTLFASPAPVRIRYYIAGVQFGVAALLILLFALVQRRHLVKVREALRQEHVLNAR